MKNFILFLVSLLSAIIGDAQTFSSSSGGTIPDGGPLVQFPITISGLTPSTIDTAFGLETICFTIYHPWDADLTISLQSPDGTIVNLSIANGGSGNNYINTCLNSNAMNSIITASAPFTGTFRPQEFIGAFNKGQNPNGTWKLRIEDTSPSDAGNLINWSITFGNNPAKPFIFDSSNLPIVIVNTGGQNIPDEPKLNAHMGIIYNGPGVRNYLTDPTNNYNNNIGIETRGYSSGGFPQKSYGFETRDITGVQKDTLLLGMPTEHDWVLYAPYNDKTCMRNVLSYDIANKTGHYASRTRFCELMINGQYQGIYVLMEKVKRDNNRVNISKLLPTDISGDALTGGYIIELDRDEASDSYWPSAYLSTGGSAIHYQYIYPKTADLIPLQKAYIQSYVDTIEDVLMSPAFNNPVTGYRKYIGVNSFIDYFILNELSKNVDGYRLSTYFFKDKQSKGGKLKAGPAWDYNLGWWNANYCSGDNSTGWAYDFSSICSDTYEPNFWWGRLLQDPGYTAQLRCRWNELRLTTLSIPVLTNYVDSMAVYLNEAQARHFMAWPILGNYTWPNPSPIPADYPGEIAALKTWINDRITWLDVNMPGTCNIGIDENGWNENAVKVFPNPFHNSFRINFYLQHPEKLNIRITDLLGRAVKNIEQEEFPSGDITFEITIGNEELDNGMYLLTIISDNGTFVKKITKAE